MLCKNMNRLSTIQEYDITGIPLPFLVSPMEVREQFAVVTLWEN